ncbi:hypothetical protein CONCODRAFT_83014 [Conidiobolus coronatus NRRL 28638]|uniref:F-box domain-containing protein n=1 Tax=Conidiobolus coronatus (strain ATCC 28846 / CBS 209.66 / NRRL 28638) TaxID=796925 RepID=A0A137PH22_CONC2|nr:hypothetical protein CONCODRAFT_83014 [Conidiobolus coronatus NRRL 28638]|eukprot:KXN74288.1 hypothetical protein CONCODRAFT_83014 [Conidiobolus coronatus NRRL 28638]
MSTEISWELVLSGNTVKSYLKLEDLTQLSLSSKLIRSKLNQNIFKLLNLTKFMNNKRFHSMFTNEAYDHKLLKLPDNKYLSQMAKQAGCQVWELKVFYNPFQKYSSFYMKDIDKFKKSFDFYKKFVKGINLRFENDYYHLLWEIPYIFPNITRLALDSSTLTLILCQALFDKLKNLTSISMKDCKLIQNRKNAIKLKFPESVEKVSLISCKLVYVRSPKAQIPYFIGKGIQLENHAYVFPAQTLPNLVCLKYHDKPQTNAVLTKFIALNPQLNSVKLDSKNISYEVMLSLSEKDIPFDLVINSKEYRIPESQIGDLPIVPNLKTLELEVPWRSRLYNILPIITPNLATLKIHFNNSNKLETIEFIQKFSTIKFLSINFNQNSIDFDLLKDFNQLRKLEEIELTGLNLLKIEVINILSYPKLNCIRVYTEEVLKRTVVKLDLPSNWKFTKYKTLLKIYKVEV